MIRLLPLLVLLAAAGCTPFLVRHPDTQDRIERLAPLIDKLDRLEANG